MKRIIACLSAFCVVMALASTVSAVTTEARIEGSYGSGGFGGRYGSGVSVSGDFAIVGADITDFKDIGTAYVYRYDGANWIEQQQLMASDGAGADFGLSVSISGNNAIVGAYNSEGNSIYSGAAYIYHYDGTRWVEQQKLIASNGAYRNHFGYSVSISGNYAIVGAHLADVNSFRTGAAYIYHYDGTSWVEQQQLTGSDSVAGDYFGMAVEISGEYAIVGAPWDDQTGPGSAYIYRFDGTNWIEQQILLASDGFSQDRFGWSVSISANKAIVGAEWGDGIVKDAGSAYIFHYDGTNWVEQQKLLANDGELYDQYGASVSISGDNAIVGAQWHDSNNVINLGAAYLYHYDGNDWVETEKLGPASTENNDFYDNYFGCSVAIFGNKAIVGAYRGINNTDGFTSGDYTYTGSSSGSAYIYAVDSTDSVLVDTDNDGYSSTYDCNDNDAFINPGTSEICGDGVDNNCDGLADSEDPICAPIIVDRDNDGYASADDCNDKDASINPGMSEVCGDGADNNCDGLTDSEDSICDPISVPTASREKGKKCYDGIDNDEDGLLDFADPDCFKKEGKGKTCSDGLDNDGDQLIDCEDPGCSTNKVCM